MKSKGKLHVEGCLAMYEALPALLDRLEKLEAVAAAAGELKRSGYDGPFMGDEVAPLFRALEELEKP